MIVLVLLSALAAYMYWPMPIKIIVSRETTYITGPLNPDGTVNYVAYLDANYAKGVTPENNAAPLLLRAIGPGLLFPPVKDETLRRLNLPTNFFDGNCPLTRWDDRSRPGKPVAVATKPAQSDEEDAPYEDDGDTDTGPSLGDVHEMLLAGQVHPELEAWLASNAKALELVRQAANKERFYLPVISNSNPSCVYKIVPILVPLQSVAMAMMSRALVKAARNDIQGAWDDVLTIHRLGTLIGQSPSTIGQLVAMGIEGEAAKTGTFLATHYAMPADQAIVLLNKLAALSPLGDAMTLMSRHERFFMLDLVMMQSRGIDIDAMTEGKTAKKTPPNLDWNLMLSEVNFWYDRLVDAYRIPRFQGGQQARDAFEHDLRMSITQSSHTFLGPLWPILREFGGRPFRKARTLNTARMIVAIATPTLAAFNGADQARMMREIEMLAVAFACYHTQHGRWPAELKELCPSLLKTIPADRFSGKPLVYRPSKDGYLLYSIGKNMRDDGGQWNTPGPDAGEKTDDIVAEVKPSDAKPAETSPAAKPIASSDVQAIIGCLSAMPYNPRRASPSPPSASREVSYHHEPADQQDGEQQRQPVEILLDERRDLRAEDPHHAGDEEEPCRAADGGRDEEDAEEHARAGHLLSRSENSGGYCNDLERYRREAGGEDYPEVPLVVKPADAVEHGRGEAGHVVVEEPVDAALPQQPADAEAEDRSSDAGDRADRRVAEPAFAVAQHQWHEKHVRRDGEEAAFGEAQAEQRDRGRGAVGPAQRPVVDSPVHVPPWHAFVRAELRAAVRAELHVGLDGQTAARAHRLGGVGLRAGVDLGDGSVLRLA